MYLMKHENQVKSQTNNENERLDIIVDHNSEPLNPRIYSKNKQIIKTSYTHSNLKVLNVGIRNNEDFNDI